MYNYRIKLIDGDQFAVFDSSKLPVGSVLPFDVYCQEKDGMKVLFARGTIFSPLEKNIVVRNEFTNLYAKLFEAWQINQLLFGKKRKVSSFLDDQIEFQKYSTQKASYFHIDSTLLKPGSEIDFDLFVINRSSFSQIVEATEGDPFEIKTGLSDIQGDIAVKKSDISRYLHYLTSLEGNAAGTAGSIARESARAIMKNVLEDPYDVLKIEEACRASNKLTQYLSENKDSIYNLLLLKNNDFYHYTHSVNTALLSIRLGIEAGMDKETLGKLGNGAMLHDIGKSLIPNHILNKQGKLDHTEYVVFQSHVVEGVKILRRDEKIIPQESFVAVLQHHEKLNGRGYPNKLKNKDIKLFGRITAIADCYDAMISRRPFRPAQSSFKALSAIAKETKSYDPALLRLFIQMLAKIK